MMKFVHIKDFLRSIDVEPQSVVLGDFDAIGEITAKRHRSREDPNYSKYGYTYKANYERGIMLYHIIRQYELTSFLEIGFGRGYSTFCAAKAFHDMGVKGNIVTIDTKFDKDYLEALTQIFPREWFEQIKFTNGSSQEILPKINDQFDVCLIDGDHSYFATKNDWLMTKNLTKKVMIFDDYHQGSGGDPNIQCAQAIDEIDWESEGFSEPQLVKLDRRMFVDDRYYTDDQINYGQVVALRKGVTLRSNEW